MSFQTNISAVSLLFRTSGKEWALNKKPILFLTIFFVSIALLHTGQDFLHSYLNGYQGYLADSLIFKIYWILFIPTLSFVYYRVIQVKEKSQPNCQWLVGIVGIMLLSALHIVLVALLIVGISYMFFYHPFSLSTPIHYFTSEYIYLTLFFYASGLGLIFFYKGRRSSPTETTSITSVELDENSSEKLSDFISVSVQNKLIPIPLKEVIYIRSDRPYVSIHTCNGQFLHSATLKGMLEKLAHHRFLRIHRSMIVNIEQVEYIRSRSNGDYDVTLKNGEVIRMSRNYYAAFRKLMS